MIRDISRCTQCGDWWCNWCEAHYADCACPGTHETSEVECLDETPNSSGPLALGGRNLHDRGFAVVSASSDPSSKHKLLELKEALLGTLNGSFVRVEISLSQEEFGPKVAIYGTLESEGGRYRVLTETTPKSYTYFTDTDVIGIGRNMPQYKNNIGADAVIYLGGETTNPWEGNVVDGNTDGFLVVDGDEPIILCTPQKEK